MRGSPETLLTEIGTWVDSGTALQVAPAVIEELPTKWSAYYNITEGEAEAGSARFEYIPDCDTLFFLSIELDPSVANQGFMTRWLDYGADVLREFAVRRASSSPAGYAVQVFETAGWLPNIEDGLGKVCCYY